MVNYYIQRSGVSVIDALLDEAKWQTPTGQTANITYSFPQVTAYAADDYSEFDNWWALTSQEQKMVRQAFKAWSAVANITFTEVNDARTYGDIRVAHTDMGAGTNGYTYTINSGTYYIGDPYLTPYPIAGDIWLSNFDAPMVEGNFNYHTVLHEIGHAIGLKHPFEGGVQLPSWQDNAQYTLMSYDDHPFKTYLNPDETGGWLERAQPITPMLLDIRAVQYIYGANYDYNADDTRYEFDDAADIQTLWDGGGNDTLDFSALTDGVNINLAPGAFSSVGYFFDAYARPITAHHNIAIAYSAWIENVIGSAYNDEIIGNDTSNIINAGAGDDHIWASAGSDYIDGGAGQDVIYFTGALAEYKNQKISADVIVTDNQLQREGSNQLANIELIRFSNATADLTVNQTVEGLDSVSVSRIAELYTGFFNRTPEAGGYVYWLNELKKGADLNAIADRFYDAGIQYGIYEVSQTDSDFVKTLYSNVLGRDESANPPGEQEVQWWLDWLHQPGQTKGGMALQMLDDSRAFTDDPVVGWVIDLLDNKAEVARIFALEFGINFDNPETNIAVGQQIAAAISADDITTALSLVGISDMPIA